MVEIVKINVGDIVTLKKPHPCGVNEWEVTRLGMEIGLVCRGCGRKVRLVRYDFDRRFRSFIKRVEGQDTADSGSVES
ncbi:MAG: DUF951 domain-containing protein [Candidatus Aquicultor sp.]|nr:DUF951 domain-containing protein [Candidatus Aquicultor sp.]